jgi:hypothetical protein
MGNFITGSFAMSGSYTNPSSLPESELDDALGVEVSRDTNEVLAKRVTDLEDYVAETFVRIKKLEETIQNLTNPPD